MAVDQGVDETTQLLAQAGFGVVVVVQVDLDLAVTAFAQIDQLVDVLRPVFLFREEERMAGVSAVGITMALAG